MMAVPPEITTLVFDWGDTLMKVDAQYDAPMVEWPEVHTVDGAQEALKALHGRYHLAVASNASASSAAQIRGALARVGLDEFISEIFTFAELDARKPDPAFFRRIARKFGAAPDQLVMIGDAYEADIPGARRAGWRTGWFNPGRMAAPGPAPLHDMEFCHLAELPAALERLDLPDELTCQVWYLEQEGSENLWQHAVAVGLAAYQLAVWLRAAGLPADPLLAHRGGLLHDIAKISAKRSHGNHGEMGAEVLLARGQPALAEISRRHMIFYLFNPEKRPRTWEEKVVHFADKICEGPRLVEWEERLLGLAERYPDQIESLRGCTPAVMALRGEIAAAVGIPAEEMVSRLRKAIIR